MKKALKKIIPAKYLQNLVNLKKYIGGGFHKKTYSDSGEDLILAYKMFPEKEKGVYVDVGAFHPFLSSNTFLLYKRGWRGVNIDPSKTSIRAFDIHRPEDVNLNLGINDTGGTMRYHKFSHSGANTFSEIVAEEKKKEPWIEYLGSDRVPVVPLGEILERYLANHKIDVLDVDVEGFDLRVLKSNNWSRFKPRVVLVEDPGFNVLNATESRIYTYLTQRGYVLHAFVGKTLIFKLQS